MLVHVKLRILIEQSLPSEVVIYQFLNVLKGQGFHRANVLIFLFVFLVDAVWSSGLYSPSRGKLSAAPWFLEAKKKSQDDMLGMQNLLYSILHISVD